MSVEVIQLLLMSFLKKYINNSSTLLESYEQNFNELLNEHDFHFNINPTILEKFLKKINPKIVSKVSQDVNYGNENYTCTFINGIFQWNESCLPEGVTILLLSEAQSAFSSFFELQEERWNKKEKNLFCLLNKITSQEGIFLFFPKFLKQPLNLCLKNIINNPETAVMPRLHILIGDGVCINMDIEQDFFSLSEESFFNGVMDVFLGINSSLIISQKMYQLKKYDVFEFWSIRVNLSEKASFSSYFFNRERGCSLVYYDIHILLEGVLSSACVQTGMLLEEKSEGIIKVQMDHSASNTSSRQTIKTIVNDEAKSNFEGGIFISSEAQETDAYQKFSGLMLAKESLIKASPQLRILADDVKASHGASIKQLEENLIFYLRSRGISQAYAKQLLIESFFNDLVLNTF